MGTKSKFFRVFVEGETISDGRKITPEMIDECVATFNVATYTPRINIEHIAGYSPEPPFNGYGDVIAVSAKTESFTIAGKAENRRALYAQVDANDQLVTLAERDQKPFPSVELTPSYAGTGKFGLVGLAFTDTPASIGTQRLQFSHRAPGTVFASAADAVAIEFEARPVGATGIADAIRSGFAALGTMFARAEPEKPVETPPVKPANDNFDPAAFAKAIGDTMATNMATVLKPVTDAQAAFRTEFDALKAQLERTEQPNFTRPPATGGGGAIVADC